MDKRSKDQLATIEAYKKVFETPAGEIVLMDIARSCGFMSSNYSEVATDMAYNLGMEDFFKRILSTLGTDTMAMINRFKEEEEINNRNREG